LKARAAGRPPGRECPTGAGNKNQIARNKGQARRNEIKAQRNRNQGRRNKSKMQTR
jgi:hypothetical protein